MLDRKSRISTVLVVLALVGGGLFYFLRGDDGSQVDATAEDPSRAKRALLEKKRAARARGEIDLSPCSAAGRGWPGRRGRGDSAHAQGV